jgi:hypothetical protein
MSHFVARLMGLEGRVDAQNWAVEPDRFGRPPVELRLPHRRRLDLLDLLDRSEPDPTATIPYDEIVYRLEQQTDDGTLIYRRITEAIRPDLGDGRNDAEM